MTEKELLHKRERKNRRRRERKKELAKDPLKMAEKELRHLKDIAEGQRRLKALYATLVPEES